MQFNRKTTTTVDWLDTVCYTACISLLSHEAVEATHRLKQSYLCSTLYKTTVSSCRGQRAGIISEEQPLQLWPVAPSLQKERSQKKPQNQFTHWASCQAAIIIILTNQQSYKNKYPQRFCATQWHFEAIVWISRSFLYSALRLPHTGGQTLLA